MHHRTRTLFSFCALLLLCIIWGYNWIVMKVALSYIDAFQFAAIRTFLGAVVLLALMMALKMPCKPTLVKETMLIGMLQTTGFTGMIIWALVSGGAGKIAVLSFTMPFWVMLFAWPILHEKLHGFQWLATLLAVLGLINIFEPWRTHTGVFSNILAVMAGICWALAVVLSKKMHHQLHQINTLSLTAWQMLWGSLPLAVVALLVDAPPITWTPYLIGASLFNVLLANSLGWWLWVYALKHLPARIASSTSLLIPVIAVLTAWIHLNEIPTSAEITGILLIGLSLILTTYLYTAAERPPE